MALNKIHSHESKEHQEAPAEFVLLILKPAVVNNPIVRAEILSELSEVGKITHSFINHKTTREDVKTHYDDIIHKYYGPPIVKFLSSKEVDILIFEEKKNTILQGQQSFPEKLRSQLLGPSDPRDASEGHIRRKAVQYNLPFIHEVNIPKEEQIDNNTRALDNLVHCSDSLDNALREIKVWFKDYPEIISKYEYQREQIQIYRLKNHMENIKTEVKNKVHEKLLT